MENSRADSQVGFFFINMKKYILTIDIGNTHIVFGLFYSSELIESKRIATDRLKTEDEYYVIIKNLFGDIISLEKIVLT